jgi:hypothetical protein
MYAGQFFNVSLLLAKKLPHPSFPAATLVQCHAMAVWHFELPLANPVLWRWSMRMNSLVQFHIWKAHPSVHNKTIDHEEKKLQMPHDIFMQLLLASNLGEMENICPLFS